MFAKPVVSSIGRVMRPGVLALVGLLLAPLGVHAQNVRNEATVAPPSGVTNVGTTCTTLAGQSTPANSVAFSNGVCTAADTDPLTRESDLSIIKTQSTDGGATFVSSTATVNQGAVVRFRLEIRNIGPSAVTSASFADVVPGNFTSVSVLSAAPAAACSAGASANTVSGTFTGAKDATCTVILQATATTGTSGVGVVNTGTVTAPAGTSDPTPGNNSSAVTTIITSPQLSLEKSASSTTFTIGTPASYTLTLTNVGSGATTAPAVITDSVPAGLSIGTLPPGCVASGQTVTCTVAAGMAIGAGNAVSFVIPVTPTAAAASRVTNVANVTGGGDASCPSDERCQGTAIVDIPNPKLTSTKTVTSTGPYGVGDVISYSVVATNSGNATLTHVVVSDSRLSPSSTSCATLAPGASCTLTGSYTVLQADADAGKVINTAAITTDTPGACAVAADCAPTVTTPITQTPKLTSTKTVTSTGPYGVGDAITYAVVATNGGNMTLANVVVTDTKLSPSSTTCATLAPGASCTLSGSYTVLQTDVDAGQVINTATIGTDTPGACATAGDCAPTVTTPITQTPKLTSTKTVTSTGPYGVGDAISYSVVATNSGNTTLTNVVVTDTKLSPSSTTCATLAPGASCTLSGSYTVLQGDVDAGQVINTATIGTDTPGACATAGDCAPTVTTPITQTPKLTSTKTVTSPGPYGVGDAISYSVVATNAGNMTLVNVLVADSKLTPSSIGCTTLAPGATCTLSGTYTVTQADVDAGKVINTALVTTGTRDACATAADCAPTVTTPVEQNASLSIDKTAQQATYAVVGEVITYQYAVTNTGNVTINGLRVADDRIATVSCPVTSLAPAASTVCTASYTVTQADVTAGTVTNIATANGTPTGGTLVPPSDTVTITLKAHSITASDDAATTPQNTPVTVSVLGNDRLDGQPVDPTTVTVTQVSTPANGNAVINADGTVTYTPAPGFAGTDTFTYRICENGNPANCATATVTITVLPNEIEAKDDADTTEPNTPVTTPVTGNDTTTGIPLDPGSVTVVTPPANGSVVVHPDGSVTYTPNPNFTGTDTYVYRVCDTSRPTASCDTATVVIVVKPNRIEAIDDTGRTEVDTPVSVNVIGNDTTTRVPLDPASVTVLTPPGNGTVSCAAGSCVYTPNPGFVGQDSFVYRVCDLSVPTPVCDTATVNLTVEGSTQVRVTKQANPRDVKVGDLVRYNVTLENIGSVDVVDGTLVDTPPAGFTLVEGSLEVADRDGVGRQVGSHPIRVDQIDIASGDRATVSYLLRVGAGVRAGLHTNTAEMHDNGSRVSNVATATVQMVADPMTDESTLIGTVFDDRDGDGWQDSAEMTDVRVQGGFAAGAYIASSTTVDHGKGPQPEPDASAPLLHGIAIGRIGGRQSDADPAQAREVVVSQLLRAPEFTGDFVLTTGQGATLRMDAAGTTVVSADGGDAARGLTAAVPSVERRISQVEGGYRVDYVIRNEGVDERGIPGVRIASVEGLLVETDQFGRYNLIGIDGGRDERGRNFILKVDPATLPPGSVFTTANPLVRRITPGLPVRFDFGVKLPPGLVKGQGTQQVEMELGQVMFAPASAQIRSQYQPMIGRMAEQVRAHDGGEVVIGAQGEDELLAFERAVAVRKALVAELPAEVAARTRVSLRTVTTDADSTVVGLSSWPVLGNVLFDTDTANIKPEYGALLRRIGAYLVEMDGRMVKITGHADRRASDAHNDALGMRRARAVLDAITAAMPEAQRKDVRVEIVPGELNASSERAVQEAKP
ncbi:Ig-like domain-containing protein [Stenotrophomonas sp.]|uniref:DUF7507 domain-containing protein n=1 Tax=Stenotrophomonas sp. TaxID=69392 RepID=UPI0028A9A978|nr:Ig-like domain-containing protein [Stenotrophomonas sp.]